MLASLYKVLFEVQFLHEYYLTDADQSSVFDPTNIKDTAGYLAARQQQNRPSATKAVQFVMPAATQQLFRNYGLRLVNTYSGFKVIAKVTATTLADGTTAYAPVVKLPVDCNLFFLIQPSDDLLGTTTNGRMRREIGSLYFFNNGAVGGAKTFPVLSNPIPAGVTNGSYAYQQGELAINNGKIQFAYYATNNKNVQFGSVSGDGFANESDRMLVGLGFNYRFAPGDNVTNASFVLKDVSGTVIKTINMTAATSLGVVSLDFSVDAEGNLLPVHTLPDAKLSDPILYTLTVTGTGSYSKTFNLVFYDDAEFSGSWGVIQLQTTVSGASYSLLDANGRLTSPVFQIRLKSLPTFRRYVNNTGLAMGLATSLTNILVVNGGQLSTILPVPLTYMPYFFVPNQWANAPPAGASGGAATGASGAAAGATGAAGGTPAAGAAAVGKGTVYLPAPDPGGSMDLSNNQLSSLILVPVSPLFPLPQQNAPVGGTTGGGASGAPGSAAGGAVSGAAGPPAGAAGGGSAGAAGASGGAGGA